MFCKIIPLNKVYDCFSFLNHRNQFSTVWTVGSMVTVCLCKQTMTFGCWFLYMEADKHSFPQITLCRLKFGHNGSSKIICCSHLNGIKDTIKRSSRVLLGCEVGCNLFRCQNILVAPSLGNPKKSIQVPNRKKNCVQD